MSRRFSLPIFLIIAFLIGTLVVSVRVQKVEASETIYIRADGSIDPPTANITSADNVTYTFIGNINESIVVERNNTVVDGAGYTLQGSGSGNGFNWSGINNVTIKHTNIKNFYYSIWLDYSSNNSISGNNITNNVWGIFLSSSSSNIISGNNITNNIAYNAIGIRLFSSSSNSISGNNITANNDNGIYLSSSSTYNSISGNNITNNWTGITLGFYPNYNSISGNNITNNRTSIRLEFSSNYNSIQGNNITNNDYGIWLSSSSSNSISGNDITANNAVGIRLDYSYSNRVFHNNLISKTNQVYSSDSVNIWDDGYPSGGNFWSNYTGVDTDLDGIGDSNHAIASNNTDYYPLMGMFSSFNTSLGNYVNIVSNSTVKQFRYFEENKTITMYTSNMTVNQTHGFCRVCIPHSLINATEGSIEVIINEGLTTTLNLNNTLYDNGTHRWIYFEYEHSTHKIDIIPEFSSIIMLSLFIITTLLATMFYRRKRLPKLI